MTLTRRQFLQIAGTATAGAVAFTGCSPRESELLVESAARLPEDMVTGIDNWYATICRMCPAGCGVIVRVMEGRAKKIEGNPDYPVNKGKLCARGQAGLQALYHPDRIQGPMRRTGERGSGQFERISWDEGLNELMGQLKPLQASSQLNEIALLTRPVRGHLIALLSRFVRASRGAGLFSLQAPDYANLRIGAGRVLPTDPRQPTFPVPHFDIANARFIISFGADFLGTWLSPVQYGVAYGQFRGRTPDRGVLVQVEPRITSTGASADLWIPIKPGTEGALALGMAQVIVSEGLVTQAAAQSAGFFPNSALLRDYNPQSVSQATGVPEEQIVRLARRFAGQGPSLAVGGGPAAAHKSGAFNLTAVYLLNRLVGNLGQTGGILMNPAPPLPEVWQPTWGFPPSLWQGLAESIRTGRAWPPNTDAVVIIPPKVLLVWDANPVHDLPPAIGFREALQKAPYIASFSSFMDETSAMADLILPAHTYLEDWGSDIPEPGPGFQVVGLQQPVVNPIYDTRSFGDILLTIAGGLGLDKDIPWKTFKDLLREGAQGLMALKRGSIQAAGFEEYWMRLLQRGGWWDEGMRGAFPSSITSINIQPEAPTFAGSEQEYPFHLLPFPSTGLGAGEGAHLPWLQAKPDPITTAVWQTWVELNLETGRSMGLEEGDIVKVESTMGSLEAPAYLHPGIRPDVVAIPMGQGHEAYGRYAQDRGANVLELVDPMVPQPDGGMAWAATRVRVTRTGESGRVSKAEGRVFTVEPSDEEVVGVIHQ